MTEGQVLEGCEPYKIFDGITDSETGRWHASTDESLVKVFPKILSIDTHCEKGHEPTVTELRFWRSPDRNKRYTREVYVYLGDKPYDPDAGSSFISQFGDFTLFSELYLSENHHMTLMPVRHSFHSSVISPCSPSFTSARITI